MIVGQLAEAQHESGKCRGATLGEESQPCHRPGARLRGGIPDSVPRGNETRHKGLRSLSWRAESKAAACFC